ISWPLVWSMTLGGLTLGGTGRAATPGAIGDVPGDAAADLAGRRAAFIREGSGARAALPLYGAVELWDWLDARAPLVAFLDEAARSERARADVRGRAAYL